VARITRSQLISQPVEQVFRVVIDGANFARWNPTVRMSRLLTDGPIGEGTRFEWKLKGFGLVTQELQEFEPNKRVRIVPLIKTLGGGHRFIFHGQGQTTRIDHELELIPRGVFKLAAPIMVVMGRKNLRDTADALEHYLGDS